MPVGLSQLANLIADLPTGIFTTKLECGPMPNVMASRPK